ncbi:kelch repeat-containing protein [Methylocapsa sp. D3K7]|uniref:kelch repeat-containing protein n=1 Tax=Methylocapsa sp. D3K7 TaxID=3041435 RepID=UPI00244E73C3|nr:kelch repeat-containing protein [Methylocapsa sp. D3K7]WGJ13529.1 kelch repeat-containing protein [Methylocapsa sp. D3K7]
MNKLSCIWTMAAGLFVWIGGENGALAQTLPPAPLPPISRHSLKPPSSDTKQLSAAAQRFSQPLAAASGPSPWRPLTRQPPFNSGAMLLLTDGTLMVHDQGAKNNGSSNWWRLTPDINGSYLNGTWSKLAPLPAGYAPLYFACAVLADGRVIIEGGEYNNGLESFTNLGAIYDPVTNKWTPVPPPKGEEWSMIGAAASTVLAIDGAFMIGGVFTNEQALFHPADLSWFVPLKDKGNGKADINSEETWTLLPNTDVLTVDANNTDPLMNSELYLPPDGSWISGGSTKVNLPDIDEKGGGTHEMGPQLLRPDGTVFAAGATGHTAIFTPGGVGEAGSWTPGPDFPKSGGVQYGISDGSAALLPSGKVLLTASPGVNHLPPTHFFVFDGKALQPVIDTPNAAKLSSYYGYMIVLPTGQVMFNSRLGDIELYTDTGPIAPNAAPVIAAPEAASRSLISHTRAFPPDCLSVPTTLVAGTTYCLPGRQLNGLSQAASYAEGYQSATNYPLVRIERMVNAKTKHVFYARTSGHSGMAVTPNENSFTYFTVPAGIETGAATLYAVANGIASNPVSVNVAISARKK